MAVQLIDLCPNRALLDPNFDGYKLSLDQISTNKKELNIPLDRITIDPCQYSFLHARIYGLHNHLIGESIEGNDSIYFIDQNRNICKTYLDPFTNELIEPIPIWEIPKDKMRKPGDYNVCLQLVNENLAVLTDGAGQLYVLDTGSRNDDDTFTSLYSDVVIDSESNYILTDAVEHNNELHVLLTSIQQEPNEKHCTVLYWITLSQVDEIWGQTALRQLKSKGAVEYAALEKTCGAVYVVSENGCKFIINSEHPIVEIEETEGAEVKKAYVWSQTIEDLSVKVSLPKNFVENLIEVVADSQNLFVKYDSDKLFDGKLQHKVDGALASWRIKNGLLEVVLNKDEEGLMWTSLVEGGDVNGEFVLDGCILENKLAHLTSSKQEQPHTGATFNSQQIEECDFDADKTLIFERIDCITNAVTHKIHLGSHQILLTCDLDRQQPVALGIRHDVDVCIWQPKFTESFTIQHEGTLHAFGYVQASKQQRKFTVCSQDLSYSAICETGRHLFIYRQNKAVNSGELRNRATGRPIRNIAQQQVVNIPSEEVLGIYATNKALFILGDSYIMHLKM